MVLWFLLATTLPASAQVPIADGSFTTSDQVKLHYLEAGQGQAVLFIPGWLVPAEIWEMQIQELSKDHHVIVLDPRSQGRSDMTKIGNDPLRRSKDVSELMEHLHLNSVVLVGWALGAFDSLAYLRQFGPDKLKGLVLVDSPLAAAVSAPAQRGKFLRLFETDRENANGNYVWGLFKKPTPKGFSKRMIQSAALVPTDIALAALDNTMPGEAWGPSIPALRQVTLLYVITPKYAAQGAYLQEVCPQAKVETFETAGHALFVDEADRFNGLMRDFVKKASLYPAGLPSGKNRKVPVAAAEDLAPTPVPSPLPVDTPTPLPANTMTPTPSSTPTPEAAPGFTPSPEMTPSPTPLRASLPTPGSGIHAPTPTPGESFFEKISKTLKTYRGKPVTPEPRVTVIPTAPVLELTSREPYLEAGPVQDGYFNTSDHVRLHYLESGHGLAIVLIPGWLLPAEIWRLQLEGLSDEFHVIALDPRSQGGSEMTRQGNEPIRQAKDIQELLDHLHLTSAVLVGWSHGGFQVLAYLGQYGPDRLYAAALVDSALGASSNTTNTAPRARFLEQFQKNRKDATAGFIWGLFKKKPPKDFFHKLTDAAAKTPTETALDLMNSAFPGDSYQPSLLTIRQIPLLYAVTPKYTNQAAYLRSVDSQARVEFFKESGHALFYDEAEHFNGALRSFLRQAALYPAGLPENKRKPAAQAGPAPTRSYLDKDLK